MNERAQFVLLAAAVFAVALVPVVTAYYGLSYDADVTESGPTVADATERTLEAELGRAARAAAPAPWSERERRARSVRQRVSRAFPALRNATPAGRVSVGFDPERARRAAERRCPSGPDRRFGACDAVGGVVVQNRSGRTTVVGATVSVAWTGTERAGNLSLFVRGETAEASARSV